MPRNRFAVLALLAGLALPAVVGCLERKESIRVARDGTVTIAIHYKGTAEELDTLDALPSARSGWQVARTVEPNGDDEEKHILTSSRVFAPGEPLPVKYAAEDDPDADLYLAFPTTLKIEQRDGATYYTFRRVYSPRRWAHTQYWNDLFFDDNIKKLSAKSPEDLTPEERKSVVQAFAGFEAFKQIEFARAAIRESAPDLRPELWLAARRALLDLYENEYDRFGSLVELCREFEGEDQAACLEREGDRILQAGYTALLGSLRKDAGFGAARLAAFEWSYHRAERFYDITDQLGGHYFKIDVTMPGTVIAHNAVDAEVDEEEDGWSSVSWEFEGDAMRDRPHEIMIVSRLQPEPEAAEEKGGHDDDR